MNNNWFESRGLKVLKYQDNAISNVQKSMGEREMTVLAAAPSAGKTIMAINIIDNYLLNNPNHRVLVLTHGTTILRTQFHDVLEEIKPDFTYNLVEKFSQYDNTKDVNICLPQTLNGNKIPNAELIVIDEAHHFYFADMVKDIIKKSKCKKQLLLTGTPSPFILKNMFIVPVTVNTIFDEGMVSDVYVEIATSSYKFDFNDYNTNDEVKTDVIFKQSDTKKTLDDLLDKIIDRLKSFKGNELINFTGWLPTLQRMQKTMFACRSIAQARQIQKYFQKIDIKSVMSTSDNDYDSHEIQNFKDDNECLVLIVVGRGILGFNYPELINVVDMSTSQNIDRIYQLLCRVIRKHPNNERKLFFKIAPNTMSDYYKYIMTGVLSLTNEYFFTHFNGKNFNDMKLPVIRRTTPIIPNDEIKHKRNNKRKFQPIVFEGLPAIELFKDVFHKKNALLHTYAFTTVRNVRAEFMNRMPHNYWTLELCLESALKYKNRKEWEENDCSAYSATLKHKELYDKCVLHMEELKKPTNYWTFEKCKEDAVNYKTRTDWAKGNGSAHQAASENRWLNVCCSHMKEIKKEKGFYTLEYCKEEALKYDSIQKWRDSDNKKSYGAAKKYGWMSECTEHMEKKRLPYTLEECKICALKYETQAQWVKNDYSYWYDANKYGWLEECTKHMNKVLNWTPELVMIEIQKYETISTFCKKCAGGYKAMLRYGLLEECCKHFKERKKPNGYWTPEKCIESAKKYKTISEWINNDATAYQNARKNGSFENCIKHMTKLEFKSKLKWTIEKCKEDALNYSSIKDWMKLGRKSYRVAQKNGWLGECITHMQK